MRTALRTSIATAALAAAVLVPAAAPAFAADAAGAAAAASRSPAAAEATASDDDRYAGEPVYIGEGLVAVLRNKEEGPEAWIRFVGSQWKPGDPYMVRVLTVLERSHPGDTVNGLLLKLAKADTAAPVLTVTKDGVTASYPLPKAGEDPAPAQSPVPPQTPEAPKAPAQAQAPQQASAQGAQPVAAADVEPQTDGPTPVVPQDALAAGAGLAAEDTDDTTTAAAGAGLAAIAAGLWAARTARSRRARSGA
ncbi:hypothetical protein AB0953_08070 [Streptomyces sp. NPDC046866]|uniref:hypothetical protein n=1 Tax=Streptomyces sp. NPDC046866 TaxID=3154921 RepID=UPI0034534D1F